MLRRNKPFGWILDTQRDGPYLKKKVRLVEIQTPTQGNPIGRSMTAHSPVLTPVLFFLLISLSFSQAKFQCTFNKSILFFIFYPFKYCISLKSRVSLTSGDVCILLQTGALRFSFILYKPERVEEQFLVFQIKAVDSRHVLTPFWRWPVSCAHHTQVILRPHTADGHESNQTSYSLPT